MNDKQLREFEQLAQQVAQFTDAVDRAVPTGFASVVEWLDEHRAEFEAAKGVVSNAAKEAVTWAKEHEQELRALNAAVDEAGSGKEFVEQLRQHLRSTEEDIKKGDYEVALMVVGLAKVAQVVNDDAEELHRKLYKYSTQPDLHDWMLEMYDRTGLRPVRCSQMEEALALHSEGRFWGSVPVLIAAFEGVVTDALIEAGLAVKFKGRMYPTDANGERKKQARPLSGIYPKLGAAKNATTDENDTEEPETSEDESSDTDKNRFAELQSIEFTYGEAGSRLNRVRNAILHGEELGYATQKCSTQFVFSLFAVLEELVYSGILDE